MPQDVQISQNWVQRTLAVGLILEAAAGVSCEILSGSVGSASEGFSKSVFIAAENN